MLFHRKNGRNKKCHKAWLYAVVFGGRFSTLLILFLFASFMIQPFHKAMAMEALAETTEEAPVADEVKEQVNESPPAEESPPEEQVEEITEEPEIDTGVLGVDEGEVEETPDGDVPEESVDTSEESSDDEQVVDESTEAETVSDADSDSSEDTASDNISENSENDEGSLEGKPREDTVVEAQYLVTEENYYQFNKNACVEMGDGTYHCSSKTSEAADSASVVYSEQGSSGNLEIFLKTSRGKVKQLTDNEFDDSSPNYDPESMRVVWHRLIDGRYQIIVYDVMEGEETQLTFSKTNNMEPKVSESGIVWQAWDGNDWEIMLFDGSYTDQLTDNDAQDVSPVIQDGYVLWSVLGDEEQQARVYSLETKETTSIVGYEGGAIENPRFVLVYDTKFENGDVVTQGFDPTTGMSAPITSKPAPAPVNIPAPDPIGEIVALINGKSSSKSDGDLGDTPDDGGNASSTPPDPLSLDLGAPVSPVSTSTDFELTEYDLVLPVD